MKQNNTKFNKFKKKNVSQHDKTMKFRNKNFFLFKLNKSETKSRFPMYLKHFDYYDNHQQT